MVETAIGRPRRLLAPAVALLAVGLLTAMVVSGHSGRASSSSSFAPAGVMPEPPGEIDRVEMTTSAGRWAFVRAPDGWRAAPDGRPAPPSLASHLDDSIKFMHVSAPIRVMERAEWSPIGLREFGLDPPGYTATLYRRGARGARSGVRGAEPAEGAAVHEARRTRPGLPDVALRRRGMGNGAPRGDRRVSAALGRVGLGLLMLAAGAAAARAHVGGSTGYASITVSRSTVRYDAEPADGRPAVGSGRGAAARADGQPAESGQAPRRAAPAHRPPRRTAPAASRVRARSRPRPSTPPPSRCISTSRAGARCGISSWRTISSTSSAPTTTPWRRSRPTARRGSWPSPRSRVRRDIRLGARDGGDAEGAILQARRRAHPDRVRPPPLPRGPAAPRRSSPVALQDHHRLHRRPQHHAGPRRPGPRHRAGAARRVRHRRVHRLRGPREHPSARMRRPSAGSSASSSASSTASASRPR